MSENAKVSQAEMIPELTTISLECSACKQPLSFYTHKDGSKTLGCFTCFERPILTHSDWNKIMAKLELL